MSPGRRGVAAAGRGPHCPSPPTRSPAGGAAAARGAGRGRPTAQALRCRWLVGGCTEKLTDKHVKMRLGGRLRTGRCGEETSRSQAGGREGNPPQPSVQPSIPGGSARRGGNARVITTCLTVPGGGGLPGGSITLTARTWNWLPRGSQGTQARGADSAHMAQWASQPERLGGRLDLPCGPTAAVPGPPRQHAGRILPGEIGVWSVLPYHERPPRPQPCETLEAPGPSRTSL